MFCNKCGNKIENTDGVRFCNKCGNDLSASIASMKSAVAEPQPQVVNPVVEQAPKVDLEKRKSNKTKLWITAVVCCVAWTIVIWILIFALLFMLGNFISDLAYNYEGDYGYEYNQDEEEKVNNNKDEGKTENKNENKTETETEKEEEEEGKRVGSEEFGYITVPDNWYKFIDVDGNDTLQYSYANVYIATLYAIDTETADAETYANSCWYTIENAGATNIKGAQVTVAGYDAYQVYGYYEEENIWLVMWFFETGDGKTRYIAIEGPDPESEFFKIPETFSIEE